MSSKYLRGAGDSTVGLLDGWHDDAACQGRADLMDPPPGDRTTDARNAALALCRNCPALDPCRTWVLALPKRADPDGIAGGMTPAQRGYARRQRSRARQEVTLRG